jgi:hypothetical protein
MLLMIFGAHDQTVTDIGVFLLFLIILDLLDAPLSLFVLTNKHHLEALLPALPAVAIPALLTVLLFDGSSGVISLRSSSTF